MKSMKMCSAVVVLSSFILVCATALCAEDNIVPDVVYGHKHGMALTFDVFKPAENANGAGVLFMVSGGWRSRWGPPERAVLRFRPLVEAGFTVFSVRHGSSPKYLIPEIVADVRRSVRYIRFHADQFAVDPNRLGVYGGSAGGHLALMLATASDKGDADARDAVDRTSNRVAAVVAYFPPTDLRRLVPEPPNRNDRFPALNFNRSKAADFSPIVHVTPDDPPALLIHGDQDRLVPIAHSENILAEFKDKKVISELIAIEGAGHGFRGSARTRASEALVAWFEKYLTAK